MAWIDLHTHQIRQESNVRAILHLNPFAQVEGSQTFSVGLHPWYLEESNLMKDLDWLEPVIHHPSVLAVGECGLDRLCHVPWDLQMRAFESQWVMAQSVEKPLIIHCVKAQQEILQLLRGYQGTFVFHGFNRTLRMAEAIIDHGGCISVNGHFLTLPQGSEVALKANRQHMFLETDDRQESIQQAYLCLAEIWQESLEVVEAQMEQNAKRWGFNF